MTLKSFARTFALVLALVALASTPALAVPPDCDCQGVCKDWPTSLCRIGTAVVNCFDICGEPGLPGGYQAASLDQFLSTLAVEPSTEAPADGTAPAAAPACVR